LFMDIIHVEILYRETIVLMKQRRDEAISSRR